MITKLICNMRDDEREELAAVLGKVVNEILPQDAGFVLVVFSRTEGATGVSLVGNADADTIIRRLGPPPKITHMSIKTGPSVEVHSRRLEDR